MKKIIFACFVGFFLFSLTASAEGEKDIIKETIKKETKAFLDKDMDAWAGYWLHEDYVSHTMINAFFINQRKSWDTIYVNMKKYFESEKDAPVLKFVGDFDIKVSGKMASVAATQEETMFMFGEDRVFTYDLNYLLKKTDDGWKFVSLTSIVKTSFENTEFMNEFRLNWVGYNFLWKDKIDEAIKVFTLNTEMYPKASNTWDSLAEAYMKKGDNKKAIEYYKKSLELDPKNKNAEKMIEKMKVE